MPNTHIIDPLDQNVQTEVHSNHNYWKIEHSEMHNIVYIINNVHR